MKLSFGLLILPLLPLLSGCESLLPTGGGCGIDVLSSIPNPSNGRDNFSGMKAEILRGNCGATTGYNTEVRLVDMQSKPIGAGDGTIYALGDGTPTLHVSWKDRDNLLIDCPDCKSQGTVTLQTVKYNFTTISYAQ